MLDFPLFQHNHEQSGALLTAPTEYVSFCAAIYDSIA